MYTVKSILQRTASTAITLALCLSIYAMDAFSFDTPFEVAQSKSSGNEVMKEIENGRDFKGMTMDEVVEAIGEPWEKDTTPVKARYDQKWIYSCETDKGLTYDCVYIYFMGGRVVKADVL